MAPKPGGLKALVAGPQRKKEEEKIAASLTYVSFQLSGFDPEYSL